MSEESRKVERALREVTGGSDSDIRNLSKQLMGLAQTSLKQQESRVPNQQVMPTGMVTTQVSQDKPVFVGSGNSKKQESAPAAPTLTFRVAVNGVAADALIAATIALA